MLSKLLGVTEFEAKALERLKFQMALPAKIVLRIELGADFAEGNGYPNRVVRDEDLVHAAVNEGGRYCLITAGIVSV